MTRIGVWGLFLVAVLGSACMSGSGAELGGGPTGIDPAGELPAPQLFSVTPQLGPNTGGTAVVLAGDHFVSGTKVLIDGREATDIVIRSGTLLSATLPANPGKWDQASVAIHNPDGQTASRDDLFTYHATQIAFSGTSIPLGGQPQAVAAGDFNGDTKPDLAVIVSSSSIHVLLGDGQGGIATTIEYPFASAYSLAVGDWNGDQKLDLAAVSDGNLVSLLLGDGKGGFASAGTAVVSGSPTVILARDWNGDQKLDLALACPQSSSVSVLLGDGVGGLGTAKDIDVGYEFGRIDVGDFNADKQLDLVVTSAESSAVKLLFGNGRGDFAAPTTIFAAAAVDGLAVGDFNGDKNTDLAITTKDRLSDISILLSNGMGGFARATNYPTAPLRIGSGDDQPALQAIDVNGDQKLDLITHCSECSPGLVSVILGNGTGTFAAAIHSTTEASSKLIFAIDFNGDQKIDILLPVQLSDIINCYWGNLTGEFQGEYYAAGGGPFNAVKTGDFNGDERDDLVVADTDQTVNVFLSNEAGLPTPPIRIPTANVPCDLAIGDINLDKKLDIVIANNNSTIDILLGDGLGHFSRGTPQQLEFTYLKAYQIILADLNGDQKLDLIVAQNPNLMSTYLGDGAGGFTAVSSIPLANSQLACADFNGDQKLDCAALDYTTHDINLYLGEGMGHFAVGRSYRTPAVSFQIATADFNKDKKADLVLQRRSGPLIFLSDDAGNFSQIEKFLLSELTTVGDFNGDDNQDLASVDSNNNRIGIFLGDGKGNFADHVDLYGGRSSLAANKAKLAVGDLNGDRKLDLIHLTSSILPKINQSR